MKKVGDRRSSLSGIAIITAVWCATIAAIDPRGAFPLHDDWIYDVSTWTFVHTGQFRFPSVSVVSLRAQVLWGALWTRLFGESFDVLRASTLVLSLATLLVVYRILARAGASAWLSILGTLALLFNPVFLWSSCTFMTDVPYVFCSVVSFYFFARGLHEERLGLMIAGCVAVIVSWFIRQNGVVNLFPPLAVCGGQTLLSVLLSVLPSALRSQKTRTDKSVCPPRLLVPIIASGALFGVLLLFKREWLSSSPAMFKVHYQMWLESSFRLPEQIAVLSHYIGFNAVNCALFFLPLTLPLVAMRTRSRRALIVLAVVALLFLWRTTFLAIHGYLVPYVGQNFSDILPGPIFFDFGVGPINLADTWDGRLPYPFVLAHAARLLLTIVAASLATLLVWALAIARGNDVLKLAVTSVAFGTLMLFASGLYFDRYALDSAWALAIALPLIVPWEKRLARGAAIVGLIVVAFFSTLAVREHFAWQRARWTAYHDLRARGVAINQIDGGSEAAGYYELRDATLSEARRGHGPRTYAITFNVLPGYRVAARYPFSGFFGMRRGEVLILRRFAPQD